MNSQANIQFINFDSISEEEHPSNIPTDLLGMELNNFLLDRFESEYDIQYGNFLNSQRSQPTSLQDTQASKCFYSVNTSPAEVKLISLEESEDKIKEKQEKENSMKDTKSFYCKYDNCQKSFKFRWILDRHYLSHKPNKLFLCNYEACEKSYKSKENLTLHIKNIHLKEKPYSCKYCSSVFSHRNGRLYKIILIF